MSGKTTKQFFFEVQLNWLEGKRGILSAKDTPGTIHVATPLEFGGEGKPWTPEHLFLSSISSCFMIDSGNSSTCRQTSCVMDIDEII